MINEKDLDLIKAFVKREAQEYTPNKNKNWCDKIFDNIVKGVNKIKGKANYIHIKSFGNVGCLSAQLILTVKNGKWSQEKDIDVHICACGRLEHWGSIREVRK